MSNKFKLGRGVRRFLADQRGNILVEFAITLPVLVWLSVGTAAVGLNLDRYLQTKHTASRAASMYRGGVDMTASPVQNLLLKSADALKIRMNSGDGVIYLSTVQMASEDVNEGRAVITHRIVIGDPEDGASLLGSPALVQSDGHVPNYESDASALATLPAGVTIPAGQKLYVAEVVHSSAGRFNFPGIISIDKMRARAIL